MNDLAFTPPKPELKTGIEAIEQPRAQYPSIKFNGPQAKAAGLTKCAIGDEYEITIRLRATRLGGDEYEMRGSEHPPAQFDVIAADTPKKVDSEADEPNPDDEKAEAAPNKKRILSPRDSGFKSAYESSDK